VVPAERPRDEAERLHPSRVLLAPPGAAPAAWPDELRDPCSAHAEQAPPEQLGEAPRVLPHGPRLSAPRTAALAPAQREPRAWALAAPQWDAARWRSHRSAGAHSLLERRVAARLDQGPPDPDAPGCPVGATEAEAAGLPLDQRRAERVPGPAVGQAQQEPPVAAREQGRLVVSAQAPPDGGPPLPLLAPAPVPVARVAAAQALALGVGALRERGRARAHRSPTRRRC
jgi:hypothetical protein